MPGVSSTFTTMTNATDSITGFLDLPVDVFLNIMQLLGPRWTVCLRQCCRFLFEITQNRGLWLDLLKESMEEHKVYPSTYPTESMSQVELENLTLKAYRLVSSLLESDGTKFASKRALALPRPSIIEDHVLRQERDLHVHTDALLVRGGRFMLTVFGGRMIILWDFGDGATGEPSIVASVSAAALGLTNDERITFKDCIITPQIDALYLVLSIYDGATPESIRICEVNPLSVNDFLLPIASLDWRGEFQIVHQDNVFIIWGTGTICLWDFRNDRSLTWGMNLDSESSALICFEEYCSVLCFRSGIFTIWKIPAISDELRGHKRLPKNEPSNVGNVFTGLGIQSSSASLDVIRAMGSPSAPKLLTVSRMNWSLLEMYYIAMGVTRRGDPTLILQPCPSANAPRSTVMYAAFYATPQSWIIAMEDTTPPCEVSLYVRADKVSSIGHAEYDGKGEVPFRDRTVSLKDTEPFGPKDLCPFSGRLITALSGNVLVYDYV